jgi:mannose-6-phosphate isomerase-like protein (cupin superfamily)
MNSEMELSIRGGTMIRWFTDTRMQIHVAGGGTSLIEAEARHGNMPPLHVHHDEDEWFYMLAGRLSLHTPSGEVEVGPGEAVLGPRGVPHTYRVESETARWLVGTNSGGFASFVEATSVPAEDDGYAPVERMVSPEVLTAEAAARGIEILGPPGLLPQALEGVA